MWHGPKALGCAKTPASKIDLPNDTFSNNLRHMAPKNLPLKLSSVLFPILVDAGMKPRHKSLLATNVPLSKMDQHRQTKSYLSECTEVTVPFHYMVLKYTKKILSQLQHQHHHNTPTAFLRYLQLQAQSLEPFIQHASTPPKYCSTQATPSMTTMIVEMAKNFLTPVQPACHTVNIAMKAPRIRESASFLNER